MNTEFEHEKLSPGRQSQQQTRGSTHPSSTPSSQAISTSECGSQELVTKPLTAREFEVDFVQGVSEEDKSLSRRDKNAVDFVFNYSKLWCKACKDIVLALEKCAYAENEACRSIAKQFQAMEVSFAVVNGAPMKNQAVSLSRMMIEKCKDTEMHNSKRCRELLEVLSRQSTLFGKIRKFHKDKWKAEVKRLLDAENSLIKTKTAYYQRCQTGVKLREELTTAQNLLNELNASMASNAGASGVTPQTGPNVYPPVSTALSLGGGSAAVPLGSNALTVMQDGSETLTDTASTQTSVSCAATTSTSNQIVKQKAKVERLEKQLSDNDKKEFEQMYSYREAVETANNRLYELEKCKMEILCDTRLTILKSDEVVKDSLAELFHHLFATRMPMINQYETMASAFQGYVPCSDYRSLVEEHIQKYVDYFPEKYQFTGFHEGSSAGLKQDALPGRVLVRVRVSSREANEGDTITTLHSDSESEEEQPGESSVVSIGKSSSSSNVISSLVEFGSSFFRPDSKKSVRSKRGQASSTPSATKQPDVTADSASAQQFSLEKDYTATSFLIARCIAAIEKQPGGLETHGIYRVPASKAKVTTLLETLQSTQPTSTGQLDDDIAILSQEHPITLAGLVKTRLIALPEPLLSYNLYPNFVELGKISDATEANITHELVKRFRILINHLTSANLNLAGLLFHHLKRVAACQSDNQMSTVNLGTMFAPTVLRQRPKFQVANMMEFMDNKGQSKVVEVLIDHAAEIFGPPDEFQPITLLHSFIRSEDIDEDSRRDSGSGSSTAKGFEEGGLTRTVGSSFTSSNSPQLAVKSSNVTPYMSSSQHGLTRSATISATSPGRSSAFLGNPLPLYSPYREDQTTSALNKPTTKTAINEPTSVTEMAQMRLNKLSEKTYLITDRLEPTQMSCRPTSPITKSDIPSTVVTATVTDTVAPQSSSVVRSIKRIVSPVTVGATSKQTLNTTTGGSDTTSTVASKQTALPDKPRTSSTASASTLANLVIGRRRPVTMATTGNLSTPTHLQPDNENEKGGFVDTDGYSYIDTDTSDPISP